MSSLSTPHAPAAPPPRLLDQVRHAIRVKRYGMRTEEAYVQWIRRFIVLDGKRHPQELALRFANGTLKRINARQMRSTLGTVGLTQMSRSPVARGAVGCEGIRPYEKELNGLFGYNADDMSRKSGFSTDISLERPGVECQPPHHPETLGRGRALEIAFGSLLGERTTRTGLLWRIRIANPFAQSPRRRR